jgi:methylglutaconyl-CoA hydratase
LSLTTLKVEIENQVALITLNRPEKRNAISPEMIRELLGSLDEIAEGAARAVILTGAGKAFCAGMDLAYLREFSSQPQTEIFEDARRIARLFRRVYTFPKPLVAAVNGPALAGGCGLATFADFTLAVPAATFGYTEVRVGFIPAIVACFVARQLGERRARELLLSGRIVEPTEARELALVTEIIAPEMLLPRARALAATLAAMSPVALAHTKKLLTKFGEAEIDRELEAAVQASVQMRTTADFQEGLQAFLEKRPPRWTGR